MYKPILVMLHIGSTGYVHKSKGKVIVVCVIPCGQCARSLSLETWLRPTAFKKKNIDVVQGLI